MPSTSKHHYLIVILLGLLSSCHSSKEVVISLSPTPGLTREMGQSFWTTNNIPADSNTVVFARQMELEAYIVTQFRHRPWEHLYQRWKTGKGDSATFITTLQRFMKETAIDGSLPPLDNESRYLFGRSKNGVYVVAADENNNNTFQDDSLHNIIPTIGKTKKNKPTAPASVRLTNLMGYDKEKVIGFSTTVNLQPAVASDDPRPSSDDFYLNLLSSETYTGQFRYGGKSYKVALRNCGYPIFNNKPEFELLKFAEGKEDSAFQKQWNTRPEYRVGDTVVLAKKVFLIKDATSLNSRITLKPLRIAPSRVTAKRTNAHLEAFVAETDQK